MIVTIDANVFVSNALPREVQHATSRAFLQSLRQSDALSQDSSVFCPTLLLAEVSAGMGRPTGDNAFALQALNDVQKFTSLNLIVLTEGRAERAARLAVASRLRAADAIYLAVAQEFNATLITWDNELLQRGVGAVPVLTPDAWLAAKVA